MTVRRGGTSSTTSLERHDLAALDALKETEVAKILNDRFSQNLLYTRLGARAIVSVNPGQPLSNVNDATCEEYVAEYRDTSGQRRILEPHLFQLTANAYLHMRRTGTDQSIVFCGETGSGKSEGKKLVFKYITMLRAQSKKETRIMRQIQSASEVIEAFGHATTVHNENASRVGTFTEIAFNDRGRVIGSKLLDYTLEKSRVAVQPAGERNFHVFYQLMGGASDEERQRWRLEDAATYAYLGRQTGVRQPTAQDATAFEGLRAALKTLGLGKKIQSQVFRCLAGILHLGSVQFTDPSRQTTEESAYVRNDEALATAAELFGLHARALEGVLTYKTQLIKSEMCTLFLNAEQCGRQRDDLARSLYGLLFSWLVEQINGKLCTESQAYFIGVLDLIGYQPDRTTRNGSGLGFENFLANFACERLHNFMLHEMFIAGSDEMGGDGVRVPRVEYVDNAPCLDLFMKPRRGLFGLMDKEASRSANIRPATDEQFLQAFNKQHSAHDNYLAVPNRHNAFAIQHFAGQATYDVDRIADKNADLLSADFVQLFRGNGGDLPGSANVFITGLFEGKSVETQTHARDDGIIVAARQSAKPTRSPSTRRMRKADDAEADDADEHDDGKGRKGARKGGKADKAGKVTGVGTQCSKGIGELVDTLEETMSWFVLCVRPNDQARPGKFDAKYVRAQVRYLQLAEIAQRRAVEYMAHFTHADFIDRYAIVLTPMGIEASRQPRAKIEAAGEIFGWSPREMCIGNKRVWLNDSAWRDLEDNLRAAENETRRRNKDGGGGGGGGGMDDNMSTYSGMTGYGGGMLAPPRALGLPGAPSVFSDDQQSYMSDDDANGSAYGDHRGGSSPYAGSSAGDYEMRRRTGGLASSAGDHGDKDVLVEQEEEEKPKMTGARRRWLCITWSLTWWIPSFCLGWCGMKRKDIRMAWREKVALCILILLACLVMLFFIIVLGKLICPRQKVYSMGELSEHGKDDSLPLTAIRGEIMNLHLVIPHAGATQKDMLKNDDYPGQDSSSQFPVQPSSLCDGADGGKSIDMALAFQNYTIQGDRTNVHDFRWYTQRATGNEATDKYTQIMTLLRRTARIAYVGWDPDDLRSMVASTNKYYVIIDKQVFDLTNYVNNNVYYLYPDGAIGRSPGNVVNFLGDDFTAIVKSNPGGDITNVFNNMYQVRQAEKNRIKVCLRNLFFVGVVDNRKSFRCQFANYMLLAVTVIMVLIIFFKFLAALQLTSRRDPEEHDRFVVCQVPCYTEGEESLKDTIDSLAVLKYDDKRKLIFIICDGMIVGSGNDRPTPRIVLDILGADPTIDPEPLSFLSLGDGIKQHNMGKVYTGLYECKGHVVPYIVVVKVGRPSERARPGNRGKRDSQLILMRFFNAVHFNSEMTPLELEMYHQIKNVIGVDPSFYEYVLMVDADTFILPDSLNRMVSAMLHDQKIIGLCGETQLANAKATWITMIQVYEYYISHHMAKAFESLFGSVTCLPGCFSMYRVRAPVKNKPLLVANQLIEEYAENRVDTLHRKNLLSLGEDRYLTTLLLKHFPTNKTAFTSDAQCRTNAPDTWSILLSQRRRWINSTVHNLFELVSLPRLCGFCCFSMRFVVFIDLFSTVVAPAAVVYIGYLIYVAATEGSEMIMISFILFGAIYGLQAIIFLLRRKWEHIGYMLISIIALPLFSFFIPIYSFWHFDDFSWGNTRLVVGDKGDKKYVAADDEKFDPRVIPRKKWSDYEQELWEVGSQHSHESRATAVTHSSHGSHRGKARADAAAPSAFGVDQSYRQSMYTIPRPVSGVFDSGYSQILPADGYAASTSPGKESQFNQSVISATMYDRPMSGAFSAYGGSMAFPQPMGSPMGSPTAPVDRDAHRAVYPSDEQILEEIRRIISTANLMTVTKKQVRDELSTFFGVDMTPRKDYINRCIEMILQGQL
ncbi:chitin synthase-domain-containing protein [Syncephalis pseudoplumigaleata]|uniref:chitin synthase n=1 Tax=Syncephalis pseudoplumigaleata TaxID=1712513 RepID=A0A4P9Z4N9_9FUNG|nr:chitin synthase-domain-containing protein [Syncephalis pseudoplumigaleata]|eukprot:RKP26540.1 chitin synthase-domain-containing protein [Syncephalis pseudoplumigaleata]